MDTNTVLLIFLAAIVSIAVVLFQYFYRNKRSTRLNIILSILRFIAIFCALVLLINPKFQKDNFYVEKSKLMILMDDSSSMTESTTTAELQQVSNELAEDRAINERFEIYRYSFGADFQQVDSLSFSNTETNISSALDEAAELSGNENTVIVLLSDGNQTVGNDYQYLKYGQSIEIHPIVIGDTTKYQDFALQRVSLNKYAFLGNQFPVETTINYQGSEAITTYLRILMDGTQVHRENLTFSEKESSKTISTLISAKNVGVRSLTIEVGQLANERNTINNRKETAIEVIDEKSRIAIVSSFLHPDIGALKKSIEANEQRDVVLVRPNLASDFFDTIDLVILYQPNTTFENAYQEIEARLLPSITITGTKTDLNFVNRKNANRFSLETGYPEQEIFGSTNQAFPHFDISTLDLTGYPPLYSNAGPLTMISEADVLMNMTIKGVKMPSPLMAIWTDNQTKHLTLFGENIWQWRAQNFKDQGSFGQFDNFMGKLMVYLSQSGKLERLELDYEKVYEGAGRGRIRASFFDKTFILDDEANLLLQLKNEEKAELNEIPMLFKGGYYEASLDNLSDGSYSFTITETTENISKSGAFKILEFDAEKQFLSTDYERLLNLAENNNGTAYFLNNVNELIENLQQGNRYVPTQKNRQKVVSLIDFRVLLAIIVLALTTEWFIRKYNGLL